MQWTQEQFAKIQKIARRHAIRCPLRVAMVTGEDPDGTRVCNCNGKINSHGETKTKPRERTLDDVRPQVFGQEVDGSNGRSVLRVDGGDVMGSGAEQ